MEDGSKKISFLRISKLWHMHNKFLNFYNYFNCFFSDFCQKQFIFLDLLDCLKHFKMIRFHFKSKILQMFLTLRVLTLTQMWVFWRWIVFSYFSILLFFNTITVSPDPLPTRVNMSLNIFDIVGVNEEQQTVTLMLRVRLMWQDFQLNVIRSEEDSKR